MELNNRKLNIKIITTESFPNGLAASNRIMCYAKGFLMNNCNVSVLCMVPTEDSKMIFNKDKSGNIDGIYFNYLCGTTVRNKHFIIRRIDAFKGTYITCFNLLNERNKEKTDAIIYYSTSTSRAFLLFFVSRIKHILFLKEENELPVGYTLSYVQKVFYINLHHLLFDGLLLMTKRLVKYYIERKKQKKPFIIVPMTVDFDRFCNIDKIQQTTRYVAYCGSLNNKKDGIDLLIDAFALLSKEFFDISLYLIGASISNEVHQLYLEKIATNHLNHKVLITGRVSKDVIPRLLCGAEILVLARPNSLQAEGGFPTKLGEYLATGNPVVVTNVGEISDYFTDEVNIFLAEPGSVLSLYNNMKKILMDYNNAMEIGAKGKNAALQYFNYVFQTKKIINFIESFKKIVDILA